jgi:hypothetical protein
MVLEEWISHYKNEGCTGFFLFDNNSTDDYLNLACLKDNCIRIFPAKENFQQLKYLNDALPLVKDFEFILTVDIDEYMFHRNLTLSEYLETVPHDVSQLEVKWRMFGSSGHSRQPESIRNAFTWCYKDISKIGKSVARIRNTTKLGIHTHEVVGTTEVDRQLQLNHYAIMSKEYFEKVKMTHRQR